MQMNFSIKTISVLLALLTATNAAAGGDAIAPADSDVVKLTSKNFESFLTENPLVLAEFFAPWCGHCKALAPQYVEAALALKEKNIPLAQIDCTEEESLCQKQNIRGYPTIKVFRGPESSKPYEGARSADAITTYMVKQGQPSVQNTTSIAFADVTKSVKEPIVLQILPETLKNKDSNSTFYEIADSKRDKMSFYTTDDAELAKKYGVKSTPVYLVYNSDFATGDEPAVYKDAKFTKEDLTAFVDSESKPYFGEINGETFQDYMTSTTPLAYVFYTTPEEREDWKNKLSKYTKEYRGKFNFVGLDATKFGKHAENLNQEEKFPLFAIHDLSKNLKYGLDQDKELSVADIEKLLKDFSSGDAKPKIKSEPIPEVQENAVQKLVAHTHDEIVFDKSKDVLVMYHASWCGHCKRLAPTYEELAAVYQKDTDAANKVVIANIEATQNDVNVDIKGFPTLIFYPAGDKENPVQFEEERDLETIANFIKKYGTHKVDGLELKKKQDEAEEIEDEEETEAETAHDEL